MTLEQDRQWVHRAMEGLNSELARLDEAQKALQTMKDSSRVIHRQGDYRLLASSFVNQDIPFFIRQTVEREALMSIRLQAADNVLVPTSFTDAYHYTGPWARAANPFEFPPAPRQSMQRSAAPQPMQTSVRSQSMQRSSLPQPMQTSFRTQPGKAYLTTMKPEPVPGWQKNTKYFVSWYYWNTFTFCTKLFY